MGGEVRWGAATGGGSEAKPGPALSELRLGVLPRPARPRRALRVSLPPVDGRDVDLRIT